MTITKVLAKTALAGALALGGLGMTSASAAPYDDGRVIVEYQARPAYVRYEDGYRWRERRCERRHHHRHDRDDWRRHDRDDWRRHDRDDRYRR